MTGAGGPRSSAGRTRVRASRRVAAAVRLATGLAVLGAALGAPAGARRASAADAPVAAPPRPVLRVRRADGAPAAGATLVAAETLTARGLSTSSAPLVDEGARSVAVLEGPGDLAAFPTGLRSGTRLFARVDGAALVEVATDLAPPAGGEPPALPLPDAAPLQVRLVRPDDGDRAPFVGLAFPEDDPTAPVRRIALGPDGTGTFRTLPAGSRWRLEARRADGLWVPLGTATAGAAEVPSAVVPAGAEVRGRVVAVEGGRGLEGLRVRVRRLGARPPGTGPSAPSLDGTDGTVAEVGSGPDGRFAVHGLPPGLYEASLLDAGRTWDGDAPRFEVERIGTTRIETWWVRARGAVVGRVRRQRGKAPVVGARVRALAPPERPAVDGGLAAPEPSVTGLDGTFRVAGLAPGPGWRLLVEADGCSPALSDAFDVAGGRDERGGIVEVVAAWRLDVRVEDGRGRPVVGAHVVAAPATRAGADPADPASAAWTRTAQTDDAGEARLDGLAEDDQTVAVDGPGIVPATLVVPRGDAGSSRAARVTVLRTVRLEGRVEATEGPLPRVAVRTTVRETGARRTATPDPTGRFVIDDVPPSPVDVAVTSPDGAYVHVEHEGFLPGGPEALVLPVRPLRRLVGFADGLDPAGPAAVVVVEASRFDDVRDRFRAEVVGRVVLPQGRPRVEVEVPDLPPGVYAVRVTQGPRDSGPQPVVLDTRDVTGLELRLPELASLDCLVADARRDASAFGATVTLVRLEADQPAPGVAPLRRTTDAFGRARFDDVAPGLYRLEVADVDAVGEAEVVRLAPGERAARRELRLTEGGRLEGVLADGRGRRAGGVGLRLLALPDLAEAPRIVTREDGTFRSAALVPGRYRLIAPPGGVDRPGAEAEVEVVSGEVTTVSLEPAGLGRIDGAVLRRGTPVPGVVVEAVVLASRGCDELVLRTTTDAAGGFHWDGLDEGRYLLRLVDGAVRSGVPVRLGRGDRVTRDLELGEGGVRGIVRTTAGDPVAGAEVVAVPVAPDRRDPDATPSGRVRTRPDGRFELTGLPVARYRLHVTPVGRPTRTVPDVVAEPAGSRPELEVVVGGGGLLDLTVRDDRGRPVLAAEVWVERADGVALHPRPYWTSPSGRLEVDGLPDSTVRVRVLARGHGRGAPVAVRVRDGLVSSLEVTVRPACTVRVRVAAGRAMLPRARVEVRRVGSDEWLPPRRTVRRPEDVGVYGTTARTGVLVIDDLEEGDYELRVSAGTSWRPVVVTTRVAPGRTAEVGVTLPPREDADGGR